LLRLFLSAILARIGVLRPFASPRLKTMPFSLECQQRNGFIRSWRT
jgi:hypothetical protein